MTGPADDVFCERLAAWVRGHVQGVGYRWYVRSRAVALGLLGTATNLGDGRVEVVAEGPRPVLERLLASLDDASAPGRVGGVAQRWSAARGEFSGFHER